MAINIQYPGQAEYYKTGHTYLYGVLNSIPSSIKVSDVSLHIKMTVTTSSKQDWKTSAGTILWIKIVTPSGTTETKLREEQSTSSTGSSVTLGYEGDKTVDFSNATKIGFMMEAWCSGNPQSASAPIYTPNLSKSFNILLTVSSTVATETKITAAKASELAGILGVSNSASKGSNITIAQYNAMATKAGVTAFNSTNPKASDLTALVDKINTSTIEIDWSATDKASYENL